MDVLNFIQSFQGMLLFCVSLVIGVIVLRFLKKRKRRCRTMQLIPFFSLIIWFLKQKDLGMLMFQTVSAMNKLYDRERFVAFNFAWMKYAFFYKPETVQVLLNSSVALDKSWEYTFMHPWLGTGLLTSSKEKWRSRRKLLTPSFHFSILKDFIAIFNEQSNILVSKLKSLANEQWIDIAPVITLCTLDIICESAMGVRMNTQTGGSPEYSIAIRGLSGAFMERIYRPWLWPDVIFYSLPCGWKYKKNLKRVHDFTKKVLKEKKEMFIQDFGISVDENSGRKRKKVFLELLLEHSFVDESFTEEDIREEIDTFMFEGHDTTAMGISWTLFCLGLYQDIQEKVYQELKEIFKDDQERDITSEDLKSMIYLECVIKESLRLYPPVPVVARKLIEDIEVLGNIIQPGFSCMIDVRMLHLDAEQFPNPEKFDPDRFLPENSIRRHLYSYIPFSAGSRNCIGKKFALLEEKVVLARILRTFQVKSLDHRDKIRVMWSFVLKNVDPIRMKFALRN